MSSVLSLGLIVWALSILMPSPPLQHEGNRVPHLFNGSKAPPTALHSPPPTTTSSTSDSTTYWTLDDEYKRSPPNKKHQPCLSEHSRSPQIKHGCSAPTRSNRQSYNHLGISSFYMYAALIGQGNYYTFCV